MGFRIHTKRFKFQVRPIFTLTSDKSQFNKEGKSLDDLKEYLGLQTRGIWKNRT